MMSGTNTKPATIGQAARAAGVTVETIRFYERRGLVEQPLRTSGFRTYSAMGADADIAIESADIIILSNRLETLATVREISRRSYAKMLQNVTLAFLFNGIGIPIAATGLVYPVWAMVAMAVSVTAIFINSLWGQPGLFIGAIMSVGRPVEIASSPVAA